VTQSKKRCGRTSGGKQKVKYLPVWYNKSTFKTLVQKEIHILLSEVDKSAFGLGDKMITNFEVM
jgi:hypothetical protein